ncbi:hypothetical protein [Streptomyces sp. NPDC059631]|uniref:hypothetical protein n=1 Tax=unclassified Streptomyces TaxID=2593676 RepID=UPI0036D1DF72
MRSRAEYDELPGPESGIVSVALDTMAPPTARPILIPTNDPSPVEKAVTDGITARIRSAWTAGGPTLGDRIDQLALAAGYDAADWLHISDRYQLSTERGRVKTWACQLRPVLADVQSGTRGPEDRREHVRRIVLKASELTGQAPRTLTPRWLGFGPALIFRKD